MQVLLKPSGIGAYRNCTSRCVQARYEQRVRRYQMPPAYLCALEMK